MLETPEWQELSLCRTLPDPELFFDSYETFPHMRKTTDDICLGCPVRTLCRDAGMDNKETGVWGGIYLVNGSISHQFNLHKTQAVWEAVAS